jgi:hypothetical protein
MPPFLLRNNRCSLANCRFAVVFATPNLDRELQLGRFAGKGQCYGSLKMGALKQNHLATAGCQSMATLQQKCRAHMPCLEKAVTIGGSYNY